MRQIPAIFCLMLLVGCAANHGAHQAVGPTTRPGGQAVASVDAMCFPPAGWKAEPLKQSGRHSHQIWLSPTGQTAYGVIHFTLPLPVGTELVLRGFLREMQRTEGEAKLLDKQSDPALPGLRFEAQGGLYHLWGNLVVSGWEGWAVYAGSRTGQPIALPELELAAAARESTRVGSR
jgi:hypothetical protein